MRDNDLFKYLTCVILVVVGYMIAWSAVTLDNLRNTGSLLETGVIVGSNRLHYVVCQSRWSDYALESGSVFFLSLKVAYPYGPYPHSASGEFRHNGEGEEPS